MPRHPAPTLIVLTASLIGGALAPSQAQDAAYRAEIAQFQKDREARLRAEDGWLSVSGLFWLKPGSTRVGSAVESDIKLRAGAPATVGVLTVEAEAGSKPAGVTFEPSPGLSILRDGKPFTGGTIHSDANGAKADVLAVGEFRFILLRRNDQYALRLKDNANPVRRDFAGLRWFPVNEDLRVVAEFKPYAIPRTITFDTVLGGHDVMPSPGTVTFTYQGQKHTLEAATEGDGKLWFVFRDATAGKLTAGNARQLTSDAPQGGYVVLDFNKAINLPCAYIEHSTCPIAPPQNRLAVEIPAGEQLPQPKPRTADTPKAD